MSIHGWIEIGLSNPNIFYGQSNPDIILRTYDESNTNKIIIGNTSSNDTLNRLGAIYIQNNNVGYKKVPESNVDLDINGLYSTIDGRVASNLTIGYGNSPGFLQLRGNMLVINSNTSDMRITNSNNSFSFTYSNIERLRCTNGSGLYLNDDVFVTNDIFASGYHMTSDSNFKENFVISKTDNDLSILKQLRVHDFNFKGVSKITKGLIAQDVQDVFPQAITEIESLIPVYQGEADMEFNILTINDKTIDLSTKFVKDDNVVVGANCMSKDYILKVVNVDYTSMCCEISQNMNYDLVSSKVFIHGKLGKMKTVDPNQIMALCVSAIQELAKRL
jgi:Chaperone of endosialidase